MSVLLQAGAFMDSLECCGVCGGCSPVSPTEASAGEAVFPGGFWDTGGARRLPSSWVCESSSIIVRVMALDSCLKSLCVYVCVCEYYGHAALHNTLTLKVMHRTHTHIHTHTHTHTK